MPQRLSVTYCYLEQKIDQFLTGDQFGFTKGRGSREAIFALRLIVEKWLEKRTYLGLTDTEKAFKNIKWFEIFQVLWKIGVQYKDRRFIWNLYKNQAVTETGNEREALH